MPIAESHIEDRGSGHTRPKVLMRALRGLVACCAIFVLIVAGGFLWFLDHVSPNEIALSEKADGIVVLTGGASRIEDAIQLLAQGNGRRLLISGVHPSTSDRAIAQLRPEHTNARDLLR